MPTKLALSHRKALLILIKVVIYGLVAWGVVAAVRRAGRQLDDQRASLEQKAVEFERRAQSQADATEVQRLKSQAKRMRMESSEFWKADWRLLLCAGLVYASSLIPAAYFWHRCLGWCKGNVAWSVSLQVYLLSLLGKYLPGKAMVIVIRILGLADHGVGAAVTTAAAFLETLNLMCVGGLVATVCMTALSALFEMDWRITLMSAIAAGVLLIATLPITIRIATSIQWMKGMSEKLLRNTGPVWTGKRMLLGWAILSFTWIGFAISLGLVLRSLEVAAHADLAEVSRLQFWLSVFGACAIGVVAGFLSMVPGGAGAREISLSLALSPVVGPTAALAGAVWLRIVWVATELALTVIVKLLQVAVYRNPTGKRVEIAEKNYEH